MSQIGLLFLSDMFHICCWILCIGNAKTFAILQKSVRLYWLYENVLGSCMKYRGHAAMGINCVVLSLFQQAHHNNKTPFLLAVCSVHGLHIIKESWKQSGKVSSSKAFWVQCFLLHIFYLHHNSTNTSAVWQELSTVASAELCGERKFDLICAVVPHYSQAFS